MFKFGVIQISLILGLALVSGYQVPDLSQANWDTALFLTPSGIIQNYLNQDTSVLWSFYGDPSSGQVSFSTINGIMMLALYLGLLLSAWLFLKNPENRR